MLTSFFPLRSISMGKSKGTITRKLGQNNTVWVLLLILLFAFLIRVGGISFGLPGLDHGDEAEVVNHAVRFGSGDLNPHRFQYGSLLQYILFVFYGIYFVLGLLLGKFTSVHQLALQFIQDPTIFYLIARYVSAFLGTATLSITYLIGKRVANEGTGLLAAAFLAFCYQHVVYSHYATVDSALTLLFTVAVYQCIVLIENDSAWRYLLAGLSIGVSIAIKFNGVIASVALIAVHLLKGGDLNVLQRIFCKKLWLGIGSVFVGHFITCPYFYIDMDAALAEIVQLRDMHISSSFNLWVYIRELVRNYWGVPLGAISALGLIRSVFTKNRKMLVLFFTSLSVFCFASLHRYVEAKYVLYSFPLLAVCGAYLLVECIARIQKRYIFIAAMLLVVHPLFLIVSWDYEHAKKSINLVAKEWIEEHIPVNAKILLDNVGNAGPKLENSLDNLSRQYQRALQHNLLKAEYLKLQLELSPVIYYNIVQIDCADGSREDDYQRYQLWQDLEEIGHSPDYYRTKGFEYIIVTDRYISKMGKEIKPIKVFKRGKKGVWIYRIE